jgi:serine/threonine protein kinase
LAEILAELAANLVKKIDASQIRLLNEIGQGEFGVVMKGIGSKITGQEDTLAVAVKILKQPYTESRVRTFVREGIRLHDLEHQNVVRLLGVCLTCEPYYIVMEYMAHGDLKTILTYVAENEIQLHFDHLVHIALDISRGVEYLQHRSFVHRDLAARNVLLDSACVAKIGDFGLTQLLLPNLVLRNCRNVEAHPSSRILHAAANRLSRQDRRGLV